eukprot:scaffold17909_cov49-Cyclotella_meneghiniana.AAC.1
MPPTKKSKTTKDGNTDCHRLSRIYCCKRRVLAEFLDRREKSLWNEDDDRDDVQFWAEQKEEYLKENPSHTSFFSAEDEDKDDGDDSDDDVVDVTDKN